MTYLKFTLWLFGLYFIYYAALIFWDLLKAKSGAADPGEHVLSFEESIAPARPEPELSTDEINSPVIASGGVSLKQLFNLAQEEAIEYTSQVSF